MPIMNCPLCTKAFLADNERGLALHWEECFASNCPVESEDAEAVPPAIESQVNATLFGNGIFLSAELIDNILKGVTPLEYGRCAQVSRAWRLATLSIAPLISWYNAHASLSNLCACAWLREHANQPGTRTEPTWIEDNANCHPRLAPRPLAADCTRDIAGSEAMRIFNVQNTDRVWITIKASSSHPICFAATCLPNTGGVLTWILCGDLKMLYQNAAGVSPNRVFFVDRATGRRLLDDTAPLSYYVKLKPLANGTPQIYLESVICDGPDMSELPTSTWKEETELGDAYRYYQMNFCRRAWNTWPGSDGRILAMQDGQFNLRHSELHMCAVQIQRPEYAFDFNAWCDRESIRMAEYST